MKLGEVIVVVAMLQRALISAQKLPDPIIITIKEQENSELNGLADVLIGSLGLAGVLILGSILAAAVFAGLLFWIRSRAD